MATYISGNDGTVAGPDWATPGLVTRWRVRDIALLPDTGGMGEDRDGFVTGPLGPAIATIEFLAPTDGTYTDANYEPGTTGIALVLKSSDVTNNLKITATATIMEMEFDVDRRGVVRGTATLKLKSDYAVVDEPA